MIGGGQLGGGSAIWVRNYRIYGPRINLFPVRLF